MRLQTLTARVLLIGLLAFEVPGALGSGAPLPGQESSHIQLLSIWVNATLEHEPGVVDEATVRVGCFAGMTIGESDVGRALVMVFSDGEDTSSWLTRDRVLESARQSDAVVYGISPGRHRSSFLPDLTSATGGRMLEVGATGDLGSVFVGILQEFRQRYLLTYVPRGVARGGWHRLDVRVNRRGARVQARPGYAGDR